MVIRILFVLLKSASSSSSSHDDSVTRCSIFVPLTTMMTVVVVKWSACVPSTPTIRFGIPLKPSVFSGEFVFETNENKQKGARVGPFFKKNNANFSKQ